MSHEDIGIAGLTWYSVLQADRVNTAGDFLVRFRLLPEEVAPYEQQIRVVVDRVEYAYDDGSQSSLTNLWSYVSQSYPKQGVMCHDIEIKFGNGALATAQFGIRDGDGEWYTDLASDLGTKMFMQGNGNEERLFDLDGTTSYNDNGSTVTRFIVFAKPRAVSAFGWARSVSGSASFDQMRVRVNVGANGMIRFDQDYKLAGELTNIDVDDYTDPVDFDPDKDLMFIEVSSSLSTSEWDLSKNPSIDVVPALGDANRITIFREIRQDRPYNPPIAGSRVDGENLHWYFTQRMFIMQDLCDSKSLSPYLDFVQYDPDLRNFTIGNQIESHLGGGAESVFSFSTIALIAGQPGFTDKGNQIIVERGDQTDGTSTVWTLEDPDDYTVDSAATTITLDASTSDDIRVRRQTKSDELWFDMRGKSPSWNRRVLGVNMTQIKFLVEEACFVPRFFEGSILSKTIFPREWNWLIYKGTPLFFIFGGPFWTGDGEISVWDNGIQLTDPTDYTTNWPTIRFTGPITRPGIGSTGNYWGDASGFTGGGGVGNEGDSLPDDQIPGGQDPPPEDQSPLDPDDPIFNAGISIGISISFISGQTLLDGVEGFPDGISAATTGTNTGSFGSNNMYLRLDLTVNQAFAGEPTAGRRVIAYIAGLCDGAVIFGFKAIAKASSTVGGYATVEASGALGCLDTNGHIANITTMWNNWLAHRGAYGDRELITAGERAMNQIIAANNHRDRDRLDAETVMIGLDIVSSGQIAGGNDGGTDDQDIRDIMGPP